MATKSLYVGNLSYSATESSLTSAFAAYGGSKVRIIEGRGFAFIDVPEDQLNLAIDGMNGQSVDGRTLTVNEARPREGGSGGGRDSSGGRSGGYGGGNSTRGSRY
jgi:RNA recognition motif-containing protein